MIKIIIVNPHDEPREKIHSVVKYLLSLTGDTMEEQVPAEVHEGDSDLDSKGQKYNPTIHTRTRAKNVDGTWRAKRTAETTVEIPKPNTPTMPLPPAPPAPTAPSVPTVVTPVVIDPMVLHAKLSEKLMQACIDKKIDQPKIIATLNKFGVKHLGELAQTDESKLRSIFETFNLLLGD